MTLDPGLATIAAAMIQVRKSKSVEEVAAVLRDARAAIDLPEKQPDSLPVNEQPAARAKRRPRTRRGSAQAA